jgi:hypothetical protein
MALFQEQREVAKIILISREGFQLMQNRKGLKRREEIIIDEEGGEIGEGRK